MGEDPIRLTHVAVLARGGPSRFAGRRRTRRSLPSRDDPRAGRRACLAAAHPALTASNALSPAVGVRRFDRAASRLEIASTKLSGGPISELMGANPRCLPG